LDQSDDRVPVGSVAEDLARVDDADEVGNDAEQREDDQNSDDDQPDPVP
jgi:hypothetical protein